MEERRRRLEGDGVGEDDDEERITRKGKAGEE